MVFAAVTAACSAVSLIVGDGAVRAGVDVGAVLADVSVEDVIFIVVCHIDHSVYEKPGWALSLWLHITCILCQSDEQNFKKI